MNKFTSIAIAAAAVLLAGQASATVTVIPDSALTASNTLYTSDFGVSAQIGGANGRNDDSSTGPIALGYTLTNFFGSDYSSIFINNNGNITFNQPLGQFTPTGPEGANQPVIAPFFADVDTRGALSGIVYVNTSIANETIITWDHVGYYGAHDDKLDTFQLVLRGDDFATPAGEGQIGFFYTDMQWETGDASGGSGGFGGTPAAVGFGDGQSNGFTLDGSIANGISGIVNDEHIWFDVSNSGTPIPVGTVPEPTNIALMLAGLGLVGAAARRRNKA
jgi:hypothetical protein